MTQVRVDAEVKMTNVDRGLVHEKTEEAQVASLVQTQDGKSEVAWPQ